MRFLSKWRPVHLVAAWCGYWLALALIGLGPAVSAIWRMSRPGQHGSANLSFGDGAFQLTVLREGTTVWSGEVSLIALALWLAVPPLLLWIFWLRAARRRRDAAAVGA